MQYGKLENGYIRYAPKTVTWQGHTVNNPDAEKLKELGYLPIRYVDMPTDAPEGKHYESGWEQTEDAIVQTWTLVEDEPVPEPQPTIEEQIAALQRALISQKIVGGGAVNITDSSENKIKDIKIFGKSEQTQDPPPSPENPQPIRNVGKYNEETGKYEVDVIVSDGEESGRKQTVTLSLDEPLRGIGNYKDEVNKGGIVRRIEEITVNADETWKASEPNNFGIINFRTRYSGNIGGYKNVLNSHFKMSNEIHADTKSENILITNSGTLYFRISETRCKTVEELKIWLQQNPLKMVQVRKEPVIEPFPEDFKQALKNLSTYYPTTVISVGDGEMYGDVELTYIADTKNYIDQKFEQINKTLVNTQAKLL